MSFETIKRYAGTVADSLIDAYQKIRWEQEQGEAGLPLGSTDTVGGRTTPAATAVGGISTGTLLFFGLLWYLLKGKRKQRGR